MIAAAEIVLHRKQDQSLDETLPIALQTSQMAVYPELVFQVSILRDKVDKLVSPNNDFVACHTTHNGRPSRTIGHRTNRKHLAAHMGGGIIPHTPEQRRHLTRQRSLDVAGALPSVLSRLFNGGVRPRAAPSRSRRETSEPHAMRACAMAPLAPCLRQID